MKIIKDRKMTDLEKRNFLVLCIRIGVLALFGVLIMLLNWKLLPISIRFLVWPPTFFGLVFTIIPLIVLRKYPKKEDRTKEKNSD